MTLEELNQRLPFRSNPLLKPYDLREVGREVISLKGKIQKEGRILFAKKLKSLRKSLDSLTDDAMRKAISFQTHNDAHRLACELVDKYGESALSSHVVHQHMGGEDPSDMWDFQFPVPYMKGERTVIVPENNTIGENRDYLRSKLSLLFGQSEAANKRADAARFKCALMTIALDLDAVEETIEGLSVTVIPVRKKYKSYTHGRHWVNAEWIAEAYADFSQRTDNPSQAVVKVQMAYADHFREEMHQAFPDKPKNTVSEISIRTIHRVLEAQWEGKPPFDTKKP
ncbi:MAG: hypothetical protein ACPG3U_07835 [Rhodothermales bacterium]